MADAVLEGLLRRVEEEGRLAPADRPGAYVERPPAATLARVRASG
jgi:hypothetical protein